MPINPIHHNTVLSLGMCELHFKLLLKKKKIRFLGRIRNNCLT